MADASLGQPARHEENPLWIGPLLSYICRKTCEGGERWSSGEQRELSEFVSQQMGTSNTSETLDAAERVWEWLCFVSGCFPHTPLSYFKRHLVMDPDAASLSRIFVAREKETTAIVGSVRVFLRAVHCGELVAKAGGIGEVCVAESQRRRGVATQVLEHAIAYMKANAFSISFLHAGGAAKLYKSLGFQPRADRVSIIPLQYLRSVKDAHADQFTIQTATWEDSETEVLLVGSLLSRLQCLTSVD